MNHFADVSLFLTSPRLRGALLCASLSISLLVGQAFPTSSETISEATDSMGARISLPMRVGLSLAFAKNSDLGYAGPAFEHAQGSISVSPSTVETGTSPTLTLSTSGFFDLSEVAPSQVGIRPSEGILDLQIKSATAQRMELAFKLSDAAAPGTRTLFIKDRNGVTVVALDLVVKLGAHVCRPACEPPKHCRDNQCILDPNICTPGCEPCQRCRNNVCADLRCNPPCKGTTVSPPEFCECGLCVPAL